MDELDGISEDVKCDVMIQITLESEMNISLLEKAVTEYINSHGAYIRIISNIYINPHQDGTAILSFKEKNECAVMTADLQSMLRRLLLSIKGIQSVGNISVRQLLKRQNYQSRICCQCGAKMVIRHGKSGPFWGCTNYPRCRHAENF